MKKRSNIFSRWGRSVLVFMLSLSNLVSAADYDMVKNDSIDWKDLDALKYVVNLI